ncbi:MAG: SDR family NAD(P)-dependent oxidoreductase, partial [Anaerolineales bacterium]
MEKLSGKVAIITGGGTGIGQGVALMLSGEGCRVVLSGRRKAPLEEALKKISDQGGEGLVVEGDVSEASDVDRLVRAAQETFGQIDILVNNAG